MESYRSRYLSASIPISALCFTNRFAWSVDRFYRFQILEDLACLYCEGDAELTSQHLVFPLGTVTTERLQRIVDFYYPAFEEKNTPLKFMYVPDNMIDMVSNISGYQASIVHKPDFDEYVYDAESLRSFSGKSLKSKKNQMNRFFRECNNCSYNSLTREDMDDCLKLTEEWCEDKGIDKYDLMNSDYIPIRIIFENFDRLNIRGGIIRLFKKAVAFSIGSQPLADTAFIHFEKADHVIGGANVVIISEVLRNEYPEVRYVNREEDMGIEGLRTAKQSFNPVYMTHKNDILLSRTGSVDK
ncbi:MAG: DUF2156 domain-containing protein [Saccharofermentanales bacterium]